METARLVAVWIWTAAPIGPLLIAGKILHRDLAVHRDSVEMQMDPVDVALAESKIRNDLMSVAKLLIMLVLGIITLAFPASAPRSVFTLAGLIAVNLLIGLRVVMNDRDYRLIRSMATPDLHVGTLYAEHVVTERVDEKTPKLEGRE